MVKISDRVKWANAVAIAKRQGGRRKNDVNFILQIYQRLGGRISSKSEDNMEKEIQFADEDKEVEKKSGPLDEIKLEGK